MIKNELIGIMYKYMAKEEKITEEDKAPTTKKERAERKDLKNKKHYTVLSIVLFVIGLFFGLSYFHSGGVAGNSLDTFLFGLIGFGEYLLTPLFFAIAFLLIKEERPGILTHTSIAALIMFLSALGIITTTFGERAGGAVGHLITNPLISFFDIYATLAFLWAIFLIAIIVVFDVHITWEHIKRALKIFSLVPLVRFINSLGDKRLIVEEPAVQNITEDVTEIPEEVVESQEDEEKSEDDPVRHAIMAARKPVKNENFDEEVRLKKMKREQINREFVPPPLSLLEQDRGKPQVGDIKANANIIKRTLQTFGITVEMDEISIGPTVTRYAIKPAEGVRVAKIAGLQNDLALALAVETVRIEAPIPGKSLVGIEVPNASKSMVGLATLLADEQYIESNIPLLVALGKNISGRPRFGNLAKMPHLLIAGTTGAGKSVMVHTIINSLLYRNSPQDLKFIMVDPKKVELTFYNKIPYLLTPVITDAKKAILALKWAVKEMERRYEVLEKESVKNIDSYHKNVRNPAYEKAEKEGRLEDEDLTLPERMPYIVVILDELADIMTVYPKELESAIVRLAQMSRAVGIHVILSTQRPEVRVITGLIKANIPGRIALKVASQIDSRTIIDMAGAEKLLGAGDILYISGETSKPERLQSAYLSEDELKRVVKYIIHTYRDEVPEELDFTGGNTPQSVGVENTIFSQVMSDDIDGNDDEAIFREARDLIVRTGKASTSYLQTKMKLGYARAARIMELLEERGVVGRSDGSKRRDVLLKPEDIGLESPHIEESAPLNE